MEEGKCVRCGQITTDHTERDSEIIFHCIDCYWLIIDTLKLPKEKGKHITHNWFKTNIWK